MRYLLLREESDYISSVDRYVSMWRLVKELDAKDIEEAVSTIPENEVVNYRIYPITEECVSINVQRSERYEKVWDKPKAVKKQIVQEYACEHGIKYDPVVTNSSKVCGICRDNRRAHY